MSHDLSHSQSQSIRLKINPLSQLSLLIYSSLDSHLHLSSFHHCLLLQILESSLHLHSQVSCHSICIFLLVLDI